MSDTTRQLHSPAIDSRYSPEHLPPPTHSEPLLPPAGGSSIEQQMDTDPDTDLTTAPSPSSSSSSYDLIPKPPGEAGRPGRGGYNLQEALQKHGWENAKFSKLRVSSFALSCWYSSYYYWQEYVFSRIDKYLNANVSFTFQDKQAVKNVMSDVSTSNRCVEGSSMLFVTTGKEKIQGA